MAHNGMLATVFFRLKQEKEELETSLSSAPEGRQAVLEEATSRRARYAEGNTPVGKAALGTPMGTPSLPMGGTTQTVNFSTTTSTLNGATGYEEPVDAVKKESGHASSGYTTPKDTSPDRSAGLRRRSILKSANGNSNGNGTDKKKRGTGMPQPDPDLPHGTSLEPSHNTMPHEPREPNVLSYSSDEKIAVLARNIDMMEDELRSNGAQGLVWPQNVTYRNYFDYMFFPTLVYQLEYPRTDT
jgi:sterol O-acyltransferase